LRRAIQKGRRTRLLLFLSDLGAALKRERVGGLSAEIAFFTTLALFPALLMLAATLGYLDAVIGRDLAQEAQSAVVDFANLIFTSEASGAIEAVEGLFEQGQTGVLTLASVGALLSLSRAFAGVIGALNLAYDCPERRTWWKRRLLGLGLALGALIMGAILISTVVIGPLLGRGDDIATLLGAEGIFRSGWRYARWPLAIVAVVAAATTLFHFAPNRGRTRWRDDIPGAIVATSLFFVTSFGVRVYVAVAGGANPVLGALGGFAIILIWIYLLAYSLLIGGEVNALLLRWQNGGGPPKAVASHVGDAYG